MSSGKQIGIILILLLLVGGGYWYLTNPAGNAGSDRSERPKRPPPTVDVVAVEPSRLSRQVEAVGTTLARRAIDIRPAASGRVVEIAFSPGSQVLEGDLLLRLDDEAESADVAEAEAERQQAKIERDRAIKLVARNTIAQASVDQLEAAFQASEARLTRALKTLSDRTVRAPFPGVTGLKQVNIGARVNDDTVITTLDDLTEIDIDFSVPEIFYGLVRVGQQIEARSVAFGDRVFEGKIATVNTRIDPEARAFRVRGRIPNDELILPAGMFMAVDLTLAEREALTLPEETILVDGEGTAVFVVKDGKAERRAVALGERNVGVVEILEGLSPGEHVVVRGIQRVRDGAPVKTVIQPKTSEGHGDRPDLTPAEGAAGA